MKRVKVKKFKHSSNSGEMRELGEIMVETGKLPIMVSKHGQMAGPMIIRMIQVAYFDEESWQLWPPGFDEITLPHEYTLKNNRDQYDWLKEERMSEKIGIDWDKVKTVGDFQEVDPQRFERLGKGIRSLSSSSSAIWYVLFGTPTGHFLAKLFSNDLIGVFSHADSENIRNLETWVKWLYNACPSEAQGSKDKYQRWIKVGGLVGWMRGGFQSLEDAS